jgi:hypothetical protein
MNRLLVSEERNNDREPYSSLCRRYGNDENNKYLSLHVLKIMTEGYQAYIDGIEHEFDGHKHDKKVPPYQKTCNPYHEYYRA